ncbi:MAG: universal stress protein [Candidatus Brocadiia bacterium]
MSIFKAYDIRGLYPDELDEELARRIGAAAGRFFEGQSVVVGRDMRRSGPALAQVIIEGLTRVGMDVVDIGAVTTPMVTFAVANYGYDGGIMVTASHNPAKYNGIKLTAKGAEPVSYETGINEIERMATSDEPIPEAESPGSVSEKDVLGDYLDHLLGAATGIQGLKLVIDAGNGMAGMLMPPLFEKIDVEVVPLYFDLDGTFPHHEANPLKAENTADLRAKVVEEKADLGIAFDGDADRVAFVDEKGQAVPCDMITALIAREVLKDHPGAKILYDLRSSWAVSEEIEACGGEPVITRVGHSFIKRLMREEDAAFGGELSGHYYFRDNFYADSGAFALLKVLSLLCREGKPLSELIQPLQRYFASGEINSEVEDKEAHIEELAHVYACGKTFRLDGLTAEFHDWWFNVRPSNTEPVLRLVVEAKTQERLDAMCQRVLARIRRPFTVRRVLFPTDFSDFSLEAMDYAVAVAEDHGAVLHVLNVVPTPEMAVQFEPMAPVLDTGFFAEMEKGAEEQLDGVVPEDVSQRVEVITAIRRGAPFLEIVRYAKEEDVDLIVIATHGRSGLRHALFGSVAEKVVRKAPCPVLSVRPKGHDFQMP